MIAATSKILDTDGKPYQRPVEPRPDALELKAPQRNVHARYDASLTTPQYGKYWENADYLDPENENSRAIRRILVSRSRYEFGNNGYYAGMILTHANFLVGTGPKLRMQTQNPDFNEMVENWWNQWAAEIQLRRKLYVQCIAKVKDGEGFGVARTNFRLQGRVKLDFQLVETEQVQSQYRIDNDPRYVDGIVFDEFGNRLWYEILPEHPGGAWSGYNLLNGENVPARFVMHWYKATRPGMQRGVPEFVSTLNIGGGSRRWRESTQAAAETAAQLGAALIKTTNAPDDGPDAVSPFSTLEVEKNMMNFLPMGWEAMQMKAEQPNAAYKEFHRAQINEQGRPKSIPVNVGMADSSEHNFASGKLDHQPWFQEIIVDRADCDGAVLSPLFSVWFEEARQVYEWGDGTQTGIPTHTWDWPHLPVADERARASADNMNLQNGSTTLSKIYSDKGQDFRQDVLPQMAMDYFGDDSDESLQMTRELLVRANFGNQQVTTNEVIE